MRAALNFLKNAMMFVLVFIVLCAFVVVWWLAVIFHGVNYLSRARR